MRPGKILHPQIASALASLGHGDIILVTDAGAPIPVMRTASILPFIPGASISLKFSPFCAMKFSSKKLFLPMRSRIIIQNYSPA